MRNVIIGKDMDAATMTEMKSLFEELAVSDADIRFDLKGVDFIDSSGVGGIVFVFKRLREKAHKVSLINVEGQPLRLLRQLQLEFMIATAQDAA